MVYQAVLIEDVIKEVVAATDAALWKQANSWLRLNNKHINYAAGGISHIVQQLSEIKNGTKYPMVALMLGVGERINGNDGGYYGTSIIKAIYIATLSDNVRLPEAKYRDNFKPILMPIFSEFMEQLTRHRYVVENHSEQIPHEAWRHAADNTTETNTIFMDFLDIIGIYNLSFTIKAPPLISCAATI